MADPLAVLDPRFMTPPRDGPELSIVIACYFEERSIDEFHRRLSAALEGTGRSYEIIFVNDGSTDGTFPHLEAIFARDESVSSVIDLFKNSGQAAAVTAGCCVARGRVFVFIDSDLQLDPEELPLLLAEYDKGYDVVSGYRADRQDPWFRTAASRLAAAVVRHAAQTTMRDLGCVFKIMNGRIVRAFEPGPFKPLRLPALIAAAQRQREIPVTHHARRHGESGWTLTKLFSFAVENLVAVSERPFQMLSLVLLSLSLLFAARLLVALIVPFTILPEITHGLLLTGMIVSFLIIVGVSASIGEYVIRSYLMLEGRPAYIVRSTLSRTVAAGEEMR